MVQTRTRRKKGNDAVSNLTVTEGLAKSTDTLQPSSEHALVVLEQSDNGQGACKTVLPGQTYERPWSLFSRRTVTGYLVNLDDQLRYRFSVKRLHQGLGGRGITLDIELRYRVHPTKAHLLVDRLDNDPLGQVVSEAKRVLSEPITRLSWEVIEASSDVTAHAIRAEGEDDDGSVLPAEERLKRYASKRGLEVRGVTVLRHLDESETAVDRERVELDRERKRTELRIEAREYQHRDLVHQQILVAERRDIEDQGEQRRQLSAASARKKAEFIQGGRTLADIDDIVRQSASPWNGAQRLSPTSRQLSGPEQTFDATIEAANEHSLVKKLLTTAYDSANALPRDLGERMRFLSAMLKVIASLLEEESQARKLHQAQLRKFYENYVRLLPDHSSEFVEQLTTQTTLRDNPDA